MKSLSFSLLLIVGLAAGTHSQQSKYQKEEIRQLNIKRVTSVVSTKQKFVSDYDRHGNLVRRVGYGPDGSTRVQESYSYDDKDNLVEAVVNRKKRTYSYKFDDNGLVIEARQLDAEGKLMERIELRHDGSGNAIEELRYGPDGKQLERRLHTYQGGNAVRQTLVYGPGGNLTSRIAYDYAGDRLARKSAYDPNGNLLRRNVYKRDPKGLVVEDLQTNEKGELVERTTSEYEFY
jgi:Rhs family protein